MTITLLGVFALFCVVTGVALAHWNGSGWSILVFSATAWMSLPIAYVATLMVMHSH